MWRVSEWVASSARAAQRAFILSAFLTAIDVTAMGFFTTHGLFVFLNL
jgi:hypothetical protein